MGITLLWPWPLTQGHQYQFGLSQCNKQPYSENRVQIGGILFTWNPDTHTYRQRHTHTHTHTQTNWSENITPPRFRGGVKMSIILPLLFFSSWQCVFVLSQNDTLPKISWHCTAFFTVSLWFTIIWQFSIKFDDLNKNCIKFTNFRKT